MFAGQTAVIALLIVLTAVRVAEAIVPPDGVPSNSPTTDEVLAWIESEIGEELEAGLDIRWQVVTFSDSLPNVDIAAQIREKRFLFDNATRWRVCETYVDGIDSRGL